MATYATVSDFEDYSEGWVTTDAPALERILEKAERDVDRILGYQGVRPDAQALKVVPADLAVRDRDALRDAVCAQAEYRIEMGERFFRQAQRQSVSGPQFSTTGTLPRIGPKVREELEGSVFSGTSMWSTVGHVPAGRRTVSSRRIR